MESLVSSVILFVLFSVTLFGLSNLYVCTLLVIVHYVWARPKRERKVRKQSSWKTMDLFHYLENVILAHLCLTIDIHSTALGLLMHKKHLVLLVQECSYFPCNYQIFSQNFPKNSLEWSLSKQVLLHDRYFFLFYSHVETRNVSVPHTGKSNCRGLQKHLTGRR